MSLLPKSQQYRDDILCWPLGAALPRDDRKHMLDGRSPEWIFEKIPHFIDITEADCRQIKGAAQPSATHEVRSAVPPQPTPVAAPPIADLANAEGAKTGADLIGYKPPSTEKPPKFKVGDTVVHRLLPNDPVIITRIGIDECGEATAWYFRNGEESNGHFKNLTLIPSEPKEADGWISHRPGDPCPVGPEVIVHCKNSTGHPSPCAPTPARTWAWDHVTAYRLVKQQ